MKCQDSDGLFPETHPLWVNSETSPRAIARYTSSGRLRDSICFPGQDGAHHRGMADDFIDTLNHYHLLLLQYCHYCPPASISAIISLLFPAAGGGPPRTHGTHAPYRTSRLSFPHRQHVKNSTLLLPTSQNHPTPKKPAPQLTIHSTLAIGYCYLSKLTS